MKFKLAFFLSILAVGALAEKFSFNGYRLIRLFPSNDEQLEFVHKLELADPEFDIWSAVHHGLKSVDVLLSPSSFERYETVFNNQRITFAVIDENIQNNMDQQDRSMVRGKESRNILLRYARYSEIMNFIDDTVSANPDLASSYSAGKTHESRDLKVIVLKTQTSRKSIWIDCGIHAREWVSPASCVYIINQLIEEYRSNEASTSAILKKYEVHILPLLNPDGYEYSHNTYRLWRKNRTPNNGSTCVGTDLNRNYGYRWLTGGSSTNPCSDTFAGSKANSELETQAVISAIQNKPGKWEAFISVHSYGNWWLTQWGHSSSEKPDDYDDIVAKGQAGADAIKAFKGSVFTVGSSASLLYVNTGSSADWAKGSANIKYAYVIELRPGPNTPDYKYGFTLPEDRMNLVAPECYLGIKGFIKAIM